MIRLICSVSFRSSCAMIASIDLMTSPPISVVCDSACSASVRTARSTASLASSVFGLNSFRNSESKSLASTAAMADACSCCAFGSAMAVLRTGFRSGPGRLACRVLRRGERLQQRGILQEPGDQLLRPGLAVHIRDQVGELLAGLEQLAERVDLA